MGDGGREQSSFLGYTGSSFTRLLADVAPDALPSDRAHEVPGESIAPHGTTVLALTFDGGVLMAGDRRATMGNLIAQRDLEKVDFADEYSAIAFAGTVGVAKGLVRLFQVEIEHYEKIESRQLSLEGKAQRLTTIVRGNLPQAAQGLVVVPLYAGYDLDHGVGRIFSFDVTGGPYEVQDFYAEGSGSPYARGALKKLYRRGMSEDDAVRAAVQALYDAADDDSATGGPDLGRRIYPVITVMTEDGYRRLPDDEVEPVVEAVVTARREEPNGPVAPLR